MRLKGTGLRSRYGFGAALSGAITLTGAALIALSPSGAIAITQAGCSSDPATPAPVDAGVEAAPPPKVKTPEEFAAEAQRSMKTITVRQLELLTAAVVELDAAIPPTDRGWDATQDAAAIVTMRDAWKRAHVAYEQVAEMLSPTYPALALSIGGRYDDFMTTLGVVGDQNLFDGDGVTGLHGVERILYSDVTPQFVKDKEMAIAGYKAAGFPATGAEAVDFKTKLVVKLVADVKALLDQYGASTIDLKFAFARVIALQDGQLDILKKTALGFETSRYSQQTLADLQAKLNGTQLSYKIFQPWLLMGHMNPQDPSKHGPAHDKPIQAGFGDLIAAYTAPQGDAIPQPPPTWNAAAPTPADLETPFGKLYALADGASNPNKPGSVVAEINIAGKILGLRD